jgi:nucleotide-binding universal stress UspA family protein
MAGDIVLGYDDTDESRAALPVEVQLIQDRPSDAIVRLADSIDARLVVVGHRQRHLLVEVFTGSVLEGVLSETSRPVVVVQPDED